MAKRVHDTVSTVASVRQVTPVKAQKDERKRDVPVERCPFAAAAPHEREHERAAKEEAQTNVTSVLQVTTGLLPHKATPLKSDRRYSTEWILHNIGGSARLRSMVTRFYNRVFTDTLLDKFVEDPSEPHGERLGNWMAEKMGGEGTIWSDSRPYGARGTAHRRAWYSHKREAGKKGSRFKLDDCRVWMRLMFWAARDEGLHEHQPFWDWFVPFIADWICVYEYSAGVYAREDAAWSADSDNIKAYEDAGREMKDVVGTGRRGW